MRSYLSIIRKHKPDQPIASVVPGLKRLFPVTGLLSTRLLFNCSFRHKTDQGKDLHLQVQILIVFKLCGNLVQFLAKNNLLLDEQVTS
jgi:hypothetical protein